MNEKELLGEFEHQVLLSALRLGDVAFTSSIVLELERRIERQVAAAAVYIALRRLEENGLVRSELREGDSRAGRRERRHFAVTREGLHLLRQSRSRFLRLWDGLELVLAEE